VVEEHPNVSAFAGSRAFSVSENIELPTGIQERADVRLPSRFVKGDYEEPTGTICQYRIDTYRMLPDQMIVNHLVGNWQKLAILTLAAFYLWLAAQDFVPFIAAGWRVTCPALLIVPANRVNVFAPAEKTPKEPDLFFNNGRSC